MALARPIPKLTVREKDVVRLVAQGFTSSEIAKRLAISEETVNGHRANVFRKLRINRSTALVAWAVKEGIA